jgi:adenylate kinase family enzyme
MDETLPLIGYYGQKDLCVDIDGQRDISDVFEDIVKVLGE